MSTSKPSFGLITAVYPSDLPQPASGVSYDVEVVMDDGSRQTFQNVGPAVQRTNADIIPAKAGQICGVYWLSDRIPLFMIVEPPYFGDCTTPTQG